ncbi:hypothetical protein CON73_18150 [Bacillus toyonensis]|uniref:Uncharacterized protein n=1 Tax=Bacillus toyonensis TaxID=155322 RepID=A0A2B7VY50_9BACI|nr:hypothetical protein CON73_18150 [Bacillus toyonensis]
MTKEQHHLSSTLYFDFCGFSKTLPFQVLVQNGKKGQLVLLDKSAPNQVKFIHQLFGIAA